MTTNDAQRSSVQTFFDSLRRSPVTRRTDDRWIGGVASGVAARLGVDPVVVRVALVVLALVGGIGAVAYGLAWLALPDTDGRIEAEAAVGGDVSGSAVAAVVVVLTSGLLPNPWAFWWGDGPWVGWDGVGGPGFLSAVLVGGLLWAWHAGVLHKKEQDGVTAEVPRSNHPVARTRGPSATMTAAALGVALLVGGGVAIAANALEGTSDALPASVRLLTAAAVTVVLGGATVLLGMSGRRDGAVGALATTAAIVTVVAAFVPGNADVRAIGDARWAPTAVEDAERGFAFGAGDARLDLTRLVLGSSDGDVVIPVTTGFGNLRVVVPDDVPVVVRTGAFIGSGDAIDLPDGWEVSGRPDGFLTQGSYVSPGARDDGQRLVVDASTLIGAIEISEAGR